ncbi:MAG TPA: hypothetical protein DCE55_28620 [Planctomycetaceae bacterium]|nr:hypothetical protein [Planctomycetaceae bacterium]
MCSPDDFMVHLQEENERIVRGLSDKWICEPLQNLESKSRKSDRSSYLPRRHCSVCPAKTNRY